MGKLDEPQDERLAWAAVSDRGYNYGLWQRELFVLRSNESYSEKWNYVFDNPVRAGLVSTAQEWKYAGEIETLML